MHKQLAACLMTLLVIGSSETIARAQTPSPRVQAAPSAISVAAHHPDLPPGTQHLNPAQPVEAATIYQEPAPLAHQNHVPIALFWDQRLEVGWFSRTHGANLILHDLPSSADVGANHPVPYFATTYGFSFSFRLNRESEP